MPEISRLSGHREWIDVGFVELERTPEPAMALGVQRSRKAIHDRVQKAELQPTSRKTPNQVAGDETVIRINDQQFWLYAVGDPATNDLLHVRLFSMTTTALTDICLRELRQKHDVETRTLPRQWRSTPPN